MNIELNYLFAEDFLKIDTSNHNTIKQVLIDRQGNI